VPFKAQVRAFVVGSRGALWLLPWAILVGLTLRADPFGLTEEGAKALLLAWSIGDQVASGVLTLGAPDTRAILFLPLGFIWPGQVIAAKILTLFVMGVAALALYRWCRQQDQAEAALLATGLLLIAPLTVDGINSLAAGPFLLAVCALASWFDRKLTNERVSALGGWFFAQILACVVAVSLHPAGLAYPVMLFLTWWKKAPEMRNREYFLIGIPIVVVFVLAMRLGWSGMNWGENPVESAAAIFNGRIELMSRLDWVLGAVLSILTLAVMVHEYRRLWATMTGGVLLLSVCLGVVAADRTWALLMFALLLYAGTPWLVRALAPLAGRGMVIERGGLWLLLLLICTAFMQVNKIGYHAGQLRRLSVEDQLISDFVEGVSNLGVADASGGHPMAPILVASSWPARTSIACKCDGLPLPPAAKDPDSQLAMMRGVSYLILGDVALNGALASNFAQAGSRIEVLSRQAGGVVLHFKAAGTAL